MKHNICYGQRGFHEEVDISRDGHTTPQHSLPLLTQFLKHYPKQFPTWKEFHNSWQHFLGGPFPYFIQPQNHTPATTGMHIDYLLELNPDDIGGDDLQPCYRAITKEQLFELNLNAFLKQLPGKQTPESFFHNWLKFIKANTTIHTSQKPSYQKHWESQKRKENFEDALCAFCIECIEEKNYFLPSHFYTTWTQR